MRLVYVMEPMCAWCYGFQPELADFLKSHQSAQIDWIMGGLAPDTDQPMDERLQQTIAAYWYQIEQTTRVTFNHDYWKLNTPYRSTYPACRAVIAAETIQAGSSQPMVEAIQSAYYQQAKNPSLIETLEACANTFGLNVSEFSSVLQSKQTDQLLQQHLAITHQLKVRGFPALFVVDDDNQAHPLTWGYCRTADLEQQLSNINDVMG